MKFSDLIKFKNSGHMSIDERSFYGARPQGEVGTMAIQAAFDESSKASSMLGAKVLAVTKRPSGDAVHIVRSNLINGVPV